MVFSFDGGGRVGPLKGSVHTFEPLAASGASDFPLKAICICFWFKRHKREVNICQGHDRQMVAVMISEPGPSSGAGSAQGPAQALATVPLL